MSFDSCFQLGFDSIEVYDFIIYLNSEFTMINITVDVLYLPLRMVFLDLINATPPCH